MASKIIIRRIGSMLPTLCLLIFVILCGTVVWLSTAGFPHSLLRYIERKAAEQGAILHIGTLKLEPSRGLALRAEGVQLYTADGSAGPTITLGSVAAGLNASHLFMGSIRPSFVQILRGELSLPVTDPTGQHLSANIAAFSARMGRGNMVQITSGKLDVQGIPIRLQGSIDLDYLEQEGLLRSRNTSTPSATDEDSLSATLLALQSKYQSIINRTYQLIAEQNWQTPERPACTVRLDIVDDFRINLRSSIPRFDIGQFHFRSAFFDILYNKNLITINRLNFKTVDPDTEASLQGGFDLQERHLSFTMRSTAAVLRMVRSMSEGPLRAYLFKFRHPDDSPPTIQLNGDIVFENAEYTLHSVRIRGLLQQKDLKVGNTVIDKIDLSFFYDNGNFNINQLDILFPDGSLRGMASAHHGSGHAQMMIDLPVQKVLTLASDITEQPIALPKDLQLGERLALSLQANLTAPAFKPGQTDWHKFIPTFHDLGLIVKSELISYVGVSLDNPEIHINLQGIKQGADLMLHALETAQLHLSASRVSLTPDGITPPYILQNPDLHLNLDHLTLGETHLPQSLAKADFSLRLSGADIPIGGKLAFGHTNLESTLCDIRLEDQADLQSLRIATAEAKAQITELLLSTVSLGALDIEISDLSQIAPLRDGSAAFTAAKIQAKATDLVHDTTPLGDAELTWDVQQHSKGYITLKTSHGDADAPCLLRVIPDWTDPHTIILSDIQVDLPPAALNLAQQLLAQDMTDFEIPGPVRLRGKCAIDRDHLGLRSGTFHIEIPQLVRTPGRVPVFKGRRIPIGIIADAEFSPGKKDDLAYNIDLRVSHDSGVFYGHINGSSAGFLRVTGDNTIRPDIVDQLIDHEDAHSIIRDFRFSSASKATISNIDTRINYANGIDIDSDCHVTLQNTEYLISAIEDTPYGSEKLRNDLGPNPYPLVTHATCDVGVKVRLDCTDKKGGALPDEILITIANPVLQYNNNPWLQRQQIKKGVPSSRLQGAAVIIDIEHSFVELQNLRGTVYPAYSLGMFYPDLVHYMKDVLLPLPAQVETQQCVFPIFSDCKRPMSGVIRVIAPQGAKFRFLGTTIPLQGFSGFISLTDDYVLLDRMNAKCWEGVLDAAVKIGISGKSTSFDGYARAQCMNFSSIASAYGSKQSQALCNADIRFRSPSPNLQDIRAYGQVSIDNGDLMTLSLFHPISELIGNLPEYFLSLEKEVAESSGDTEEKRGVFSRLFTSIFRKIGNIIGTTSDHISKTVSNIPGINHILAYDLQSVHSKFDIVNGHFFTRDMKATGYNLSVDLNIDIDLDTMYLRGNLWPRISSLPSILLTPLTFLSEYMLDINVHGPVGHIEWSIGLDERLPGQAPSATTERAQDTAPEPIKR